eukprot:TRINITY_DN660_c0_g1_i6.p4 TRINITY_DN660_c0_g1~~TRINITY_DN660_c0_g1_i6.p4  ORF type:complete len:150 (+),score=34.59 TRINITY_DN660_c0_g1_i6:152-601(+)
MCIRDRYQRRVHGDKFNEHAPAESESSLFFKEMKITNQNVLQLLNELGPFKYNTNQKNEFEDLPFLNAFAFQDGTVYSGQWKSGLRHGQGKQIWPNGTVYEGWWQDNEPDIYGRIIYEQGVAFEGEWQKGNFTGLGFQLDIEGNKSEGT